MFCTRWNVDNYLTHTSLAIFIKLPSFIVLELQQSGRSSEDVGNTSNMMLIN